jgi:hypothetical protein
MNSHLFFITLSMLYTVSTPINAASRFLRFLKAPRILIPTTATLAGCMAGSRAEDEKTRAIPSDLLARTQLLTVHFNTQDCVMSEIRRVFFTSAEERATKLALNARLLLVYAEKNNHGFHDLGSDKVIAELSSNILNNYKELICDVLENINQAKQTVILRQESAGAKNIEELNLAYDYLQSLFEIFQQAQTALAQCTDKDVLPALIAIEMSPEGRVLLPHVISTHELEKKYLAVKLACIGLGCLASLLGTLMLLKK